MEDDWITLAHTVPGFDHRKEGATHIVRVTADGRYIGITSRKDRKTASRVLNEERRKGPDTGSYARAYTEARSPELGVIQVRRETL